MRIVKHWQRFHLVDHVYSTEPVTITCEYVEWNKLHKMKKIWARWQRKEKKRTASWVDLRIIHFIWNMKVLQEFIYSYGTVCVCMLPNSMKLVYSNSDQRPKCSEEERAWQNTCTICIHSNALFPHSVHTLFNCFLSILHIHSTIYISMHNVWKRILFAIVFSFVFIFV